MNGAPHGQIPLERLETVDGIHEVPSNERNRVRPFTPRTKRHHPPLASADRGRGRVGLCPLVESPRERGGLPTACWQILLQHEDEHDVAFDGEFRDVFGDHDSSLRSSRLCYQGILGRSQPDLGNMDGIVTKRVAKQFARPASMAAPVRPQRW